MAKLIFLILMSSICGLFGCRPKTTTETKPTQPKAIPKPPVGIHQQKEGREYLDQMTFVEYLDDGDYFQILARKGDSAFSFINDIDDSRNINRGDLIQVKWKRDSITVPGDNDSRMPADILLSIKKTDDGPVSGFRTAYGRKLKYTWATNEEFTSSYLNKVYLIVEYYLTQTKNPLLQLAVKNHDEITYSIESREKDGRNYRVIGIAPVGPNGSNIVQWLYIDEESGKIYEYDLPDDKLIAID